MFSTVHTSPYPPVFIPTPDDCHQTDESSKNEIVEVWRDSIGKKPKITITSSEIQYLHCHGRQAASSSARRILECMQCSLRSLHQNSPYSKSMNISMASILRRDLSLIQQFQHQLGAREQEIIKKVKDGLYKSEEEHLSPKVNPTYREVECVVRGSYETVTPVPPLASSSAEESDPVTLSPEQADKGIRRHLVKNYTRKCVKKSYTKLKDEIELLKKAQSLSNIRGSEDFLKEASIKLEVAKEVLADKEVAAAKQLLDSKRKCTDQQKSDKPEKQPAKKRRVRSQSLGSKKIGGLTRAEAVAQYARQGSFEKSTDEGNEEPTVTTTYNRAHLDFILNPS